MSDAEVRITVRSWEKNQNFREFLYSYPNLLGAYLKTKLTPLENRNQMVA